MDDKAPTDGLSWRDLGAVLSDLSKVVDVVGTRCGFVKEEPNGDSRHARARHSVCADLVLGGGFGRGDGDGGVGKGRANGEVAQGGHCLRCVWCVNVGCVCVCVWLCVCVCVCVYVRARIQVCERNTAHMLCIQNSSTTPGRHEEKGWRTNPAENSE